MEILIIGVLLVGIASAAIEIAERIWNARTRPKKGSETGHMTGGCQE
jgi:hypothetical protein